MTELKAKCISLDTLNWNFACLHVVAVVVVLNRFIEASFTYGKIHSFSYTVL